MPSRQVFRKAQGKPFISKVVKNVNIRGGGEEVSFHLASPRGVSDFHFLVAGVYFLQARPLEMV